jgi:hypothetical protein
VTITANNNPYPDLDGNIVAMLSEQKIVKSTDIIEAMKPCSESAVRAHLQALCRKKVVKKIYHLADMRTSRYTLMEG